MRQGRCESSRYDNDDGPTDGRKDGRTDGRTTDAAALQSLRLLVGDAYLAKSDSAKLYSDVQETDKPYFAESQDSLSVTTQDVQWNPLVRATELWSKWM